MNLLRNRLCTSVTLRLKSNPFATRYVAPGCLPWISVQHETVENLARRLRQDFAMRAAIVGPHGSGKSTLLEHLVPLFGAIRHRESPDKHPFQVHETGNIVWLQLRRDLRPETQLARSRRHWAKRRLLVLDGFEQLGRIYQWWAIAATRMSRMGLLVTSHAAVALPTLVTTCIDADKARAIMDAVLQPCPTALDDRQLPDLLARHQGNMREILMDLYDQFEGH